MPLLTPHYNLIAFTFGDTYSASADKRRFSIIDNQLSFLAEQIGDGVIDGWGITKLNSTTIRIAPGMGIIDGFLTVTYGNFDIELPNNRRLYVFMRRKPEIIADTGAFSDIAEMTYDDGGTPAAPATPTLVAKTYKSVEIKWTENTEVDLFYYKVYRNGVHVSDSESASYLDESVQQNTAYNYTVRAVDYNGHTSPYSSPLMVTTEVDNRIPNDPTEIDVLSGNQVLQVYWGPSNYLANQYEITLSPITIDGEPDGTSTVVTVSNSTFYYIFNGLANGQLYEVTVKTVSTTGFKSAGVVGRATPFYTGGASELSSISVSDFSVDSSYRVGLNLSWELQDDEYNLTPDYFLVTIYRDGEVGVPSIYTTTSNVVIRYSVKVGTTEVTRDIEEETKYTIKVQTVTGDVSSNGFIVRYRTGKYRPPQPITNLNVKWEYNVNRRSVVATWENSQGTFAFNSITVKKIPIDIDDEYTDDFTEILAQDLNYGEANTYSVKVSDIENRHRYEFFVTVHDAYGNVSTVVSAQVVVLKVFATATVGGIEITNSGVRPPVPSEQYGISGNDQATIYWNEADSDFIQGYCLYRAPFSSGYLPTDFTKIVELPSTVRKFTDYTVDNGNRYVYFVTTVDVFGNESPNPADSYIYYTMVYVSPRGHSNLTKSPVILVTPSGHDALITWASGDDAFDGYEIFRSENNKYSFKSVGSVSHLENSFTDKNALVKDGKYYYMIRKFRNEAEIFTSKTRLAPAGSLSLGLVSRFGTQITVDQSDIYSIKLLADPIKDEVAAQLSKATHLFYDRGDDRRVRLQTDLVITEWSTVDYQTYTTEYSLVGTGEYIAYIDGVQSVFGTVLNIEDGTISFEQSIFDAKVNDGKKEEDRIEPPKVTVIFLGVGEVTGTLAQENVEDISASKITKGKLTSDSIPQIDHFGRYREKCVPESFALSMVNPQVYSGTTPTGVTFYDVVKTPGNKILAGTTVGIMLTSSLGGSSLDTVLQTTYAASAVLYCPFLEMYFAAVGTEVRVSTDGSSWQTASGMDGATFVRGLATDGKGAVYATSDAGVYRIEPLAFTKLFWTQLTIFDPNDINAFGIVYDAGADGIVVGGSNGIYGTFDKGENWARLDDGELQAPIHSIWIEGDTWFLVGNNKVWRKGAADTVFKVIGDFAQPCRKGVYFSGDFYVTTDQGLYRSSSNSDVLNDVTVTWEQTFRNTSRNGILPVTHALRVLDGRLWMGQDERLYSATVKRSLYTHADIAGVCPTIYVNGVEKSVGVYPSLTNQVAFDTRLEKNSEVKIVRSYTRFIIPNGGWADAKYDAEILVNINGSDVIGPPVTKLINGRFWRFPPAPWTPPNDTRTIATAVKGITTPFFNGRNSNYDKAMESLTLIVKMADAIETLDFLGEVETVPSSDVANLFKELDRFKTFIHPEIRQFVKYPAITGVINYNGFTALYDVVNGTLDITGGVNKYTKVAITIKGVSITNEGTLSHEQLEEGFDRWNSGLTAPMALVQQSNLIKTGIFLQHIDPNGLKDGGHAYQAIHHAACDEWYDKFMSTIDYEQKLEQLPPIQGAGVFESTGFSIDYPADVLYVVSLGEVWICGHGGIIAINKTTFDARKVYSTPFYVYNMVLSGGIVYALAEDGVYTINPDGGIVTKDVNLTPPTGFSSIYVNGNTTYIATKEGVFSKRPFEVDWTKVFSLTNATVRTTSKLTFAVGKNPEDATDSLVYYTFGGVIWNRSNVFEDIIVNSVTQRYNSVYYATNSGLIHEDVSKLFANADFSSSTLTAVELVENEDGEDVRVNDVDADDDRAMVVTDTGKWYSMSGASVTGSGQSRLETIHKVKVVDGKYWLFSDNLIEVENVNRLISLSTGKALF